MIKKVLFFLLLLFAFNQGFSQEMQYLPNVIVAKFLQKEAVANPQFQQIQQQHNYSIEFPFAQTNRLGETMGLQNIAFLKFNSTTPIFKLIHQLENTKLFEYVQPKYIGELAYIPNDTLFNQQYYIQQIKADSAWDVSIGSTQIKIAITDNGINYNHPDLQNKVATNTGEQLNNSDSDNNGYIDDFYGYDFIDDDGEPLPESGNNHGTMVASIAAAQTNNVTGISGVGFNCMFIPIRVANNNTVKYGFEGIYYAAIRGADVVNCSWGYYYSGAYEKSLVDFAIASKTTVVGAMGNSNSTLPFYPASYPNVIGVASVTNTNLPTAFTNYNYQVDVCTPGQNILACAINNDYIASSGSSFSAPMASAGAALIQHLHNDYRPSETLWHMRFTATKINEPSGYENKLGGGVLNLYKALTTSSNFGVDVAENSIQSNGLNFSQGDTLTFAFSGTNLFQNQPAVNAELEINHPAIQVLNSSFSGGPKLRYAAVSNTNSPFSALVTSGGLTDEEVEAFYVFTNTLGDTVRIPFSFTINQSYITVQPNEIAYSICSNGLIGYNAYNTNFGIGLQFNGTQTLFEAGLMIGHKNGTIARVVDNIRRTQTAADKDFNALSIIQEQNTMAPYSLLATSSFNDAGANFERLNLKINQRHFAYENHTKSVIAEYTITNESAVDYTDLAVGFFHDFDLINYAQNQLRTDFYRYLHTTNSSDSLWVAVQFLTQNLPFGANSIDVVDGGAGGIALFNSFSENQKYAALTENRWESGTTTIQGNDVAGVVHTKLNNLAIGDSAVFAVAILAANSLSELEQEADSIYFLYNGSLPTNVRTVALTEDLIEVSTTQNNIQIIGLNPATIQVFSIDGQLIYRTKISKNNRLNMPVKTQGIYIIQAENAEQNQSKKIVVH